MTTLTNYMIVNRNCYGLGAEAVEREQTLSDRVDDVVYPAIGIVGIAYLLYLLASM
ncbi:MAG TPA: hypothetical protein HPP76_05495 [Desulfuromonadales bacterium]|nr:hypothetical protein [Desulfuromonadales bacterium]